MFLVKINFDPFPCIPSSRRCQGCFFQLIAISLETLDDEFNLADCNVCYNFDITAFNEFLSGMADECSRSAVSVLIVPTRLSK